MDNMRGLSELDLKTIDAYRKAYAMQDREAYLQNHKMELFAPANKWLHYWEKGKSKFLFKLFGENNLILKKDIHFDRDLQHEIDKWSTTTIYREFYDEITNLLFEQYGKEPETYHCWDSIRVLFYTSYLATNRLSNNEGTICFPDGDTIVLPQNGKVSKLLGKVATKLGCEKYERFRLKHSEILNTKRTSGTLCLSIHPMDYITMSDNGCNWSSCMSWRNDGCYRMGTIEMMNSPYVVVAYIKDDKSNLSFLDSQNNECFTWNSKKWRSLFIINNDIITNIKGYPYEMKDVDEMVIKWLAELAKTNLYWEYSFETVYDIGMSEAEDFDLKYNIETYFMYNDYYCSNLHRILATHDNINETYNISGMAICAWCGDIVYSSDDEEDGIDPGDVVCANCLPRIRCAECGDLCYEDEDRPFHKYNGEYYCSNCWEHNFIETVNDNEIIPRSYAEYIHILPSEYRVYLDKGILDERVILSNDTQMSFAYNPDKDITNFLKDILVKSAKIHKHYFWGRSVSYVYADEVNDKIVNYNASDSGRTDVIKNNGTFFDRAALGINDIYYFFNNYNYWFQYINKVRAHVEATSTDYNLARIDIMIERVKQKKEDSERSIFENWDNEEEVEEL